MKTEIYAAALTLALLSMGAATAGAPDPQYEPPTEPANIEVVPEEAYRFVASPGIEDEVQKAVSIWEMGSGVTIQNPEANRTVYLNATSFDPSWEHEGKRFVGLGMAIRDSLNGYAWKCEVQVNGNLTGQKLLLVLVHEIGHCVGLGHADSGIMSGGHVEGEYPSAREYEAVRCVFETPEQCGVHLGRIDLGE